ncbi:hypothetical protein JHS3_29810 [Jeongeupia sp. HS-3]|uniref:surface-adhesin E family protein n=1 Tax=Jeongeupia sp. HS-3 TaxID=1009682 RepID=UPI0018A57743|nr:surface-adhesin E family protein [Jeongeupia sp. HS-3]BCL77245.1 hypothetical protein JHS3_29810 [Jeongeupia sp. HS-3]
MKAAAALCLSVLLAACDDYEAGTRGPQPVPGEMADWRNYGKLNDVRVDVDVNSISHRDRAGSSAYTYVWMRQTFDTDQIDGASKGKYRVKFARQAIDCPSGRMAGTAVELQDENGAEIARYDVPGYQWEFTAAEPDSYGADFVRQVCKMMADKAQNKE